MCWLARLSGRTAILRFIGLLYTALRFALLICRAVCTIEQHYTNLDMHVLIMRSVYFPAAFRGALDMIDWNLVTVPRRLACQPLLRKAGICSTRLPDREAVLTHFEIFNAMSFGVALQLGSPVCCAFNCSLILPFEPDLGSRACQPPRLSCCDHFYICLLAFPYPRSFDHDRRRITSSRQSRRQNNKELVSTRWFR